jgi:alkanesulfonate monooxygenase SsuD/methylene tetrahydromethanopterin reductase-like flavin-dependent oxidoreductase (luciferase family)
LGSLVLGNTYRHPAVAANMAATLDQISGGRLVQGIGAGWQPNEHVAYGIALPPARERIAVLDEACAVIRGLLDQDRLTFGGTAYQMRNAPCDPKPLSHVPLLVGGGGRAMLEVAARHADVWHAWAGPADFARKSPAVFARKSAVLDALCEDIGRPPGEVTRASGGTVTVGPRQSGEPSADPQDVRGTPEQMLAQLLAFRDAGVGEFIVRDDAANVPVEQALAEIETFTATVLPGLAP